MEAEFWNRRWRAGEIGFHEGEPNGMLVRYFDRLALAAGDRVFVPLCGMTRDIAWMLAGGFRVCGAELSRLAVEQLFAALGLEPTLREEGALTRFSAAGLEVLAGDVFALTEEILGPVDAIYDRAALVALPQAVRPRYAAHLVAVTGAAPQLLVTYDYDQSRMAGPPFSVPEEEVRTLYGNRFGIERLSSREIPGGLKGCSAREDAWLLRRG